MAAEMDYARVALWSVTPSIITWGLDGFFNGVQRPGISVVAALAGLVSNAVLNYALIFGHWGCPAMGIAGAALATVIGWCLRAAILTAIFLSGAFAREYQTRAAWKPSAHRLGGILRVGGPTSVQWIIDLGAWVVFMTFIMGQYGTAALAATNIGVQYMHVAFMPAVGIGIALTSLVGHAIGQGRPELAVRRATAATILICGYMGAIGLVFWLARIPLMRLLSADPAVIELGAFVLIWAAVFQAFDGLGITFSSALRGAGDTRWPMWAFVICCWGVFIFGGWEVGRKFPALGINGPWMMCTLYIVLLGVALWARFARGKWRKIRLFPHTTATGSDVIAAEAIGTPG
jgi:MATE family multidrug resistance protein